MFIKSIASVLIAALLMTGTMSMVSSTQGQGAQSPQTQTELTQEQAVAAALEHAGVTDPEGLTARMDRDERVPHWEIRWRSGDWEYEYEIHPETGAVLEWDRDHEPQRKPAETKPAETKPVETEPVETKPVEEPKPVETKPVEEPKPVETKPAEPDRLTADEALAIALDHAGLKKSQISRLERDLDLPEWDIEFDHDGWEYSYEIHAKTGKILEWEKDRDD